MPTYEPDRRPHLGHSAGLWIELDQQPDSPGFGGNLENLAAPHVEEV